jgi:hypothetical protein
MTLAAAARRVRPARSATKMIRRRCRPASQTTRRARGIEQEIANQEMAAVARRAMPFWPILLVAISVLGAFLVIWDVERTRKEIALPYWKTEPFFDLKASHWVEIFLTAALLGVGGGQLYVYSRQASIMATQAEIARTQNEISLQSARAIVFAKDVRVEKKDGAVPGKPGQFEPYLVVLADHRKWWEHNDKKYAHQRPGGH